MPEPIEHLPGEVWKPVVGYEGVYEVSNMGRVVSYARCNPHLLALGGNRRGYPVATLAKQGRMHSYLVHRLVLEAFVGPRGEGYECRHLNGNRKDNNLANICWGTPAENLADKIAHGGVTHGERNGRAILTAEIVASVRMRSLAGTTAAAMARELGVSRTAVERVIRGTTWKCVLIESATRHLAT